MRQFSDLGTITDKGQEDRSLTLTTPDHPQTHSQYPTPVNYTV